jgi:hypothetical protein
MLFQVPPANTSEADSELKSEAKSEARPKVEPKVKSEPTKVKTKSLDEKTEVNFGSKDLRTRSPAYTRDKIRDLEREIKVLEASSTRNDKAKLCKLRYTLSVFNKK